MPAHATKALLGHLPTLAMLAASFSTALAKTGTQGCTWHTTTSVTPQTTIETRVYYLPDTLEICAVDCENDPDAVGCRGPVFLQKDTIGAYIELRSPADDGDSDDDNSQSLTTTQTSSSAPSTSEPHEDPSTVLIMATAPTPVPPGITGPVTSTPTADSAGCRLASAGFIVGLALAIAAL